MSNYKISIVLILQLYKPTFARGNTQQMRAEGSLPESVFSPHNVGFRDQTQVFRFDNKLLYPLSHLVDPEVTSFL